MFVFSAWASRHLSSRRKQQRKTANTYNSSFSLSLRVDVTLNILHVVYSPECPNLLLATIKIVLLVRFRQNIAKHLRWPKVLIDPNVPLEIACDRLQINILLFL